MRSLSLYLTCFVDVAVICKFQQQEVILFFAAGQNLKVIQNKLSYT